MDSEEEETVIHDIGKKNFQSIMLRLTLAFLLPIVALFFFFSLLIGFSAVFAGHSSISTPVSVPSQCRIVSSSVDLRSSKVCELGLLNYKAKYVFYPFEKSKFRCRYDYYWASVFEVEYVDRCLGETRLALAEAPIEALPPSCRPDFGAVWLTKYKFKVNETYDCWYTSGISNVRLYHDNFFNCQAQDPSVLEMLRRYFILSTKILQSWLVHNKGKAKYWRWETIVGVITGFSTSLISISFIRILHHMKYWLPQTHVASVASMAIKSVFGRRACFFVVYFSIVSWLIIQYGKRLHLPEINRVYNH